MPSTSNDGSASARPSAWALRSTSANSPPASLILLRMKFEVPFTMPKTAWLRSPHRPSFSVRMIGMPPPTLASNPTSAPRFSAARKTSSP
jgi:hypothetical protein